MKHAIWSHLRKTIVAFSAFAPLIYSQSVWAQNLGKGDDTATASYGQVVGVIFFLLLLTAAAWFIVRAKGATLKLWTDPANRQLRIIETVRVSPQNMLCLAQWGDKQYLIAFTANGAQCVDEKMADFSGVPA